MQIDLDEQEMQLFGQTTEHFESAQFVCSNEGLKIISMKLKACVLQEVFIGRLYFYNCNI